ncbi:MAG: Hsp20/alpha crystallin family protein [Chitinophagaceae bacterium]|nr:Hsp20/alpha crystallin family protein [Chitinophagaceae bacterium]MBK9569687.1 Hsp20/alpha crystallin family protein [Chitinophagaceae bacterium]MBL0132101.1 Hsp20/alpha crystallin family protein [Chitinophagaceae bacterium]MBL0271868.1 Hsp20/alpha crystallin family protein [Chitinophagaceae bacterium]
MENKAVDKPRTSWPSVFESGWMDKFFNAPLDEFFNYGKVMNVPAVNVSETEKDFRLSIAAPGLEKKDFKVDAYDDMLTISAEHETEKKEEKNGRFNRREYNYTSWSRSFTLPENCDFGKIDAEYKNGELKISIPKVEVKEPKKTKSISVN